MSERDIVKVVARVVPWLAPVPSAWLVGRAVLVHLGFPVPVAVLTALVVEGLGLVSVYNWQWLNDWNRGKLASDVPAQPWQPAVLGVFYLVLTTGLVVVLDVLPSLATYAPAALPMLAMVGTLNLALIAGQEGREQKAKDDKVERQRKRQAARTPKTEAAKRQPETRKRKAEAASGNDTRQEAAAILAAMPDITGAELGRQLGKSERLGRLLRAELLPADGNGKE